MIEVFPFLRLPAELRNRIYELSTESTRGKKPSLCIEINKNSKKNDLYGISESDGKDDNIKIAKIPAIAQVCRQLREEFFPLYYRSSVIWILCWTTWVECREKLAEWFYHSRSYLSQLRDITITISDDRIHLHVISDSSTRMAANLDHPNDSTRMRAKFDIECKPGEGSAPACARTILELMENILRCPTTSDVFQIIQETNVAISETAIPGYSTSDQTR